MLYIMHCLTFITEDERFDNSRQLWVSAKQVPLPQARLSYD